MATPKINDYLVKQLFISRNIVTYRSLSREFGIHVNVAKNELARFYANAGSHDQRCSATYLLSGKVKDLSRSRKKYDDDGFYIESQSSSEFAPSYAVSSSWTDNSQPDEGEEVVQIQVTMVSEDRLEDAKARYVKLNSVHVYSLSPSPIQDADLLCAPAQRIRELDNQKGLELAKAVGRIIGNEIQMKETTKMKNIKGRAAAVTAVQIAQPKLKADPSTSGAGSSVTTKRDEKTKEPIKTEPSKPQQAKPSGKVGFFAPRAPSQHQEKEKGKAQDKEAVKPAQTKGRQFFGNKPAEEPAVPVSANVRTQEQETSKAAEERTKRGLKRKSTAAILSDEEDETSKSKYDVQSERDMPQMSKLPSTRSSPQPVRKRSSQSGFQTRAVPSDEDEDREEPRRRLQKKPRRNVEANEDNDKIGSETRKALESMMNMDDDEVVKVSRKVSALRQEEAEEHQEISIKNEDIEMSDHAEIKPKPKPRKRKEKKVVPVGRNGLNKRRITKSRTRIDDKGYMVTEDYSSYESVDDGEEEAVKPPELKTKGNSRKRQSAEKEKTEPTKLSETGEHSEDASEISKDTKPNTVTSKSAQPTKARANKNGSNSKGGQKQQKTLATFFGATKAKK